MTTFEKLQYAYGRLALARTFGLQKEAEDWSAAVVALKELFENECRN